MDIVNYNYTRIQTISIMRYRKYIVYLYSPRETSIWNVPLSILYLIIIDTKLERLSGVAYNVTVTI